ncbi:hypothetical protein BP6252_10628 [Coleophoma cylindrospora]|uniref:Secreted protein n=1 Tax=Coleophoma cylindrospora TaxID=1849047 RepID=A0A3D8QT72_9HELO|nr:hypothetical protein BP6252_10628 [Coleophoma cylindrospora]
MYATNFRFFPGVFGILQLLAQGPLATAFGAERSDRADRHRFPVRSQRPTFYVCLVQRDYELRQRLRRMPPVLQASAWFWAAGESHVQFRMTKDVKHVSSGIRYPVGLLTAADLCS